MADSTPDFAVSWDFLQRFHRGRPVVITGIAFDSKQVPTETFSRTDYSRFLAWVEAASKNCNLYFSVAEPMAPATKKLDRADVRSVHYLHVDVDPRAGEPLDSERTRILGILQNPMAGLPKPSAVVFSGGGYQAYWALAEPIKIDGSVEAAEDAKLYNLQIERMLDADNCHDVCRIMRLPGSVNVPSEKKKKRGQEAARAEVVYFDESLIYPLSTFLKGQPVQLASGSGGTTTRTAPSNITRLGHVNDLGDSVSNKVKVTIVQGCDPDDPNKWPSRSEMLFWVCCELCRAGITDDVIFSVITDPSFLISGSVLEKNGAAERYALRQIERARDQAIDPVLRELNDRHAVIENFGGKCRVIEESYDPVLDRKILVAQSFEDIRNRYCHRRVIVGQTAGGAPQTQPAGDWWLRHPQRRQFRTVVFSPSKPVTDAYNLWSGFACEARPGDCGLFLSHLRDVVCRGNPEHYDYLIGWIANMVQNPGSPGHTAVALRGQQGSGKSIVAVILGALFAQHYMAITQPSHLVGNFNAHLRNCVLLHAEEAFYAGDKKHEAILKTLITEPMLIVEGKGLDIQLSPSCLHLIMSSNDRWMVPVGWDDRRFFVLDVDPLHKNDVAYFKPIFDQQDRGGREALLYFLQTYNLSNFNVRAIPETAALQEQKRMTMEQETEWWMSVLRRGTLNPEHAEWQSWIPCDSLQADFLMYAQDYGINRRGNATRLGMAMKDLLPCALMRFQRGGVTRVMRPNGLFNEQPRAWCYHMPSLQRCRDYFDAKYGPQRWEADAPSEELPDYGKVEQVF